MAAAYRVIASDDLSPSGIELLARSPEIEVVNKTCSSLEELRAELANADAIIVRSKTKLGPEALDGQKRLKLIVRAGVGVDTIDLPAATRNGIVVSNTPAGNTTSTAEHSVAMLMALSRNIGPAYHSMRDGKWDKKSFKGTQLAGKSIGVIGLGRIGITVARRCRALEMNVLGYDPFLSEERAASEGIELYRNVDDLVSKCDFITVHTPLTDETRGLINAERIAKMPKGVRIINCARGGIVDEAALQAGLESGHVAGAALDVFSEEPLPGDHPLRTTKNTLLTPHLGASTDEAQEQVALEAAEIISAFLIRGEIRHAVNMAPVSAQEMQGLRPYLDLGYRLGLLMAQLTQGKPHKAARLQFKGDAATRPIKLITNAFTAGLLSSALAESVNILNAEMLAKDRGIQISCTGSSEVGAFSTLVAATVETDTAVVSAAGTTFGNEFLRLVRLEDFQMDAYLDGLMLLYRHKDVPGLIGAIGTTFGKHAVNISHMALGREKAEPGGQAIAVLNLDNEPSEAALAEVSAHPDVTGVQLVKLPPARAPLPWFGL
ncbi:MAG: phosphoglycerate dehydrogenase [Planctomycetaceae bacterium]|nr:phosphoglycerate dehydrogenase [Planctomycetaceae bacterium]